MSARVDPRPSADVGFTFGREIGITCHIFFTQVMRINIVTSKSEDGSQEQQPHGEPHLVLIEFLNTLNLSAGHDRLRDPSGVSLWAKETLGEPAFTPSIEDLALAVQVREAIREILSQEEGKPPSAVLIELLSRASRLAQVSLHFGGEKTSLRPAGSGPERIIGRVLAALHEVSVRGSLLRIKVCRNPECRWAFFDHSKNRSRVWCRMAECGNRMKARRFRLRRASEPVPAPR